MHRIVIEKDKSNMLSIVLTLCVPVTYIYMPWQVLTVCHAVVVLCANDIFMCHESDILAPRGMHFCGHGNF